MYLVSHGVVLHHVKTHHGGMKMWRPDPAGTETSLRRIYARRKYPHVYTLRISTCKNQSAKAQ